MKTDKNIYIKNALFIFKPKYNHANIELYQVQSSVLERRRTHELDITKNDLMRLGIGATLLLDTFDIYRFSTAKLYL